MQFQKYGFPVGAGVEPLPHLLQLKAKLASSFAFLFV
jgi:hypothetical protein